MKDYLGHLIEYYRCPDTSLRIELSAPLSASSGYFRFLGRTLCMLASMASL